jgi:hypothetical protein
VINYGRVENAGAMKPRDRLTWFGKLFLGTATHSSNDDKFYVAFWALY